MATPHSPSSLVPLRPLGHQEASYSKVWAFQRATLRMLSTARKFDGLFQLLVPE